MKRVVLAILAVVCTCSLSQAEAQKLYFGFGIGQDNAKSTGITYTHEIMPRADISIGMDYGWIENSEGIVDIEASAFGIGIGIPVLLNERKSTTRFYITPSLNYTFSHDGDITVEDILEVSADVDGAFGFGLGTRVETNLSDKLVFSFGGGWAWWQDTDVEVLSYEIEAENLNGWNVGAALGFRF